MYTVGTCCYSSVYRNLRRPKIWTGLCSPFRMHLAQGLTNQQQMMEAPAWTWAVTIETCECKGISKSHLQTKPRYSVLCDTRAGDRPSVGDRPTVQRRLGLWRTSCIFLPTLLTLWILSRNRPHSTPGIAFVCPPWRSAIESIWVQRGHFHGFCIASHQEKVATVWQLPLLAQEKHVQNSK